MIYDSNNELFSQEKNVSQIDSFPSGNGVLTPPDTENDWNFLVAPIRLSYSEDKDDKDKDNTLIWWDWNDKNDYPNLYNTNGMNPDYFAGISKYRKGNKEDDLRTMYMGYMVLWVNSDYSSVTTGSGTAEIPLPADDAKMDDWEFIASPIRMGDSTETEHEDRKDSSLLMTKCIISSGDTAWNVEGSYLWCDHEKDADSVRWRDGQIDGLFVRTNILADISVNT